ncbi:Endonuclease III (EC [Olavius algarvensis Delta 1 endosymbiont]|nr:Endonuclease III (EC [Olavius algarvensis Delta 1 endosymbiont]
MKLKTRADRIRRILKERYPQAVTPLYHETPFQLLVATILSAQCTDNQVNKVTRQLYKRLKTPNDFARAQIRTIEKHIRSTGFYHNKAKNIKNCSKMILEIHGGQVPRTLEELVKLPGVGRKTANVVLGAVFDTPGIVVDTHVGRISRRLDFTAHKDPVKVEFDLMEIIPRQDWSDFSLRLVFFGREICSARKPRCPICPVHKLCPWPDKTT